LENTTAHNTFFRIHTYKVIDKAIPLYDFFYKVNV